MSDLIKPVTGKANVAKAHHVNIQESMEYLEDVRHKISRLFSDIIGKDSCAREEACEPNMTLYEVLERAPDLIRAQVNEINDSIDAIRLHLFNS